MHLSRTAAMMRADRARRGHRARLALQDLGCRPAPARTVVNDVLGPSKIEAAGNLALESGDFTLHSMLSRVVWLVASEARTKVLELVKNPDHLAHAACDLPRRDPHLADFTQSAGQRRQVHRPRLGDRAVRDEEQQSSSILLRFAVHDIGIGVGVASYQMAGLFTPFEHARNPTTGRLGNAGQGLSITRNSARQMGGHAGAESAHWVGQHATCCARATFRPALGIPSVSGRQPTGREAVC